MLLNRKFNSKIKHIKRIIITSNNLMLLSEVKFQKTTIT